MTDTSKEPAVGAGPAAVRLEPRGDRAAPLVFKQGAHPPYAIRWYGATSLFGHFRNFIASAIASESVDSRDWMRPLEAEGLLANVARVLGLDGSRPTLLEALDRPLWVDWVADTGDDRDVSLAVGRMVLGEYTVDDDDGAPLALPRGDVLLFGGDTAYPVATADEIYRRVVQPWNEVLREREHEPRARPRVLLGIPGNHDWYDGLDGFGRFFRRRAHSIERRVDAQGAAARVAAGHEPIADGGSIRPEPPEPARPLAHGRKVGLAVRGLHLDEVGGTLKMVADASRMIRAFFRGTKVSRRRRLTLDGYEAVQESSYWALPLAPGLELWGVDRQLGRLDFRQRGYFLERRRVVGDDAGIWIVAPDPALGFGDKWDPGARMLAGCRLSLEHDRVLYMCGDIHHYERRVVRESLHVIAGGGGAFLHGTRIAPGRKAAARAYPDARQSRALVAQVPVRLMLGRAGYLVHIALALVAMFELGIGWHHRARLEGAAVAVTAAIAAVLYAIAGHKRVHRGRILAVALPFGALLGLLPMGLSLLAPRVVPLMQRDTLITLLYAFLGALIFGVFLAAVAVSGLEVQQAFTVLGHPGFKHFVRLRISPDGTIDAWAIGKDDPLATEGPWVIDRWRWRARGEAAGAGAVSAAKPGA